RVRAVLHFTGRITLGVDVGDFLQLQRAFQSDWIVNSPAEVQKIGVTEKLACEVFDRRVALQDGFDLMWGARKFPHQALGLWGAEFAARLAELQRREHERRELP